MPQQSMGTSAAEARTHLSAFDGSRLAGVPLQESVAETERDFSGGHPDSSYLSGSADPPFADGENPRSCRDDGGSQEFLRRVASGSPPLPAQGHHKRPGG